MADIYGQVIYPDADSGYYIPLNVNNNAITSTVVYLDGEKYDVTDLTGCFAFHNVPVGKHTLKVEDN